MARAKLSKAELAVKACVPITTLRSAVEREACRPETAGRLAAALGVDVTEILADE